ncbi:uridine-ribohydrolase 2 [Perilla frutescens var. hirtella]|uniref:Uridine-ribohydrolase 2 n=1 Tax=Perilla frutescens var. hirtella TaxID=608512 RepID=A0AAD4PD42_PERFH|nr:uridine-ribohydrolase 2 [Perilla frutescens var. hirtella]
MEEPKKIIIDTDPGVDDAMAIFVALQSPEVEVIGLTTIYGNVYTTLATRNALHLVSLSLSLNYIVFSFWEIAVEMLDLMGAAVRSSDTSLEIAGRTDIPVAEGSHVTITVCTKLRIADFVHGTDGLGNQNFPPPKGAPIKQSAAEFLVKQTNLYPGKVTVVALGPLTNIALAIQSDPEFVKNVGQIVLLGGAFSVNGNVNPAAEANIFGDPDAADIVFTSGADILAIGINVTHQVVLTDADQDKLAESSGKLAQYMCKILDVYFSYHHDAYSTKGVYLHDPTTVLAAVDPSLITYVEGAVRVQTVGITRGLTLFYNKQKRFAEVTEWSDKPSVKVAVTVNAPEVVKLVMERLMNS